VSPRRRELSARKLRGRRLSLSAVGLLSAVLLGLGLLSLEFPAIWTREQVQTQPVSSTAAGNIRGPSVTTCFTPAQACADLIVGILDHAQSEIRLQAYGFSSSPILSALVSAKRRGVDAVVILDKSDDRASPGRSGNGAEFVAHAGIPVFIDYRPAIAHNKVIVVDRHIVVTGSYNFTAAAEHRNSENVTVVDSPEVASQFLSNWQSRRAASKTFVDTSR
jgi:phospholipase D